MKPAHVTFQPLTKAHVVFVNSWNLEEISRNPLVAVSANIEPLEFAKQHNHSEHEEENQEESQDEHNKEHGYEDETKHSEENPEDEHHDHEWADPHVSQGIDNVIQWVKNIQQVLSTFGPAKASLHKSIR